MSAVEAYRSLWLGGKESGSDIWNRKFKLADLAIEELQEIIVQMDINAKQAYTDMCFVDEARKRAEGFINWCWAHDRIPNSAAREDWEAECT